MNKAGASQFSKSTRRYMLPFNYNIVITPFAQGGAVCLSPGNQPRSCKEFLVQSDYGNSAICSIGFSGTNLVNGLQLTGGQGWIFSIFGFGESSRIVVAPTNWVQGLDNAQNQLHDYSESGQQTTLLNVADFYAASASSISQNLIVFFFTVPEVGR